MTTRITEAEVSSTARQRMADHVAFGTRLSLADCEDLIDADLADPADFGPHPDDHAAYRYGGDRWDVDLASGRARLVERGELPEPRPGPHLRRAQLVFGNLIRMFDRVGQPCSDELIENMRADGWGGILARAAQRDATDELLDIIYGTGCEGETTPGKDVTDDAKE